MANLNKVLLIGRLTRAPELRYTKTGKAVCSFSIAVNSFYTGSNSEKQENVCFLDVSAWGRQGETCAEYLNKGSTVFVEGRLRLEKWEKDGQRKSKHSISARVIQFLDSRSRYGGMQSADEVVSTSSK